MEYGSIERELHVDAVPEVVFEVVSSPEHISEWWTDDAEVEATPGAVGELVWGDRADVVPITVVNAEPPRLFSFRWCYPEGKVDDSANSLLATFELTPSGTGTRIRATETRCRECSQERGVPRAAGVNPMTAPVDDDLWSAVGDPTRRRMLDLLLADGDGTATSLSEQLPVTRQAIAKHLGVLDRVGLVHATPAGRERRYRVDEAQLARAVAQLSSVGAAWDARLRRIKRIAEAIQRRKDQRGIQQ